MGNAKSLSTEAVVETLITLLASWNANENVLDHKLDQIVERNLWLVHAELLFEGFITIQRMGNAKSLSTEAVVETLTTSGLKESA